MFCSSCGTSFAPGLSYCKRCGAGLNAKDLDSTKLQGASHETLVQALAWVSIAGIGLIIGLMAVMKEVVHFNNELILAGAFFAFLFFLLIDSVIIWLLLRPRRDAKAVFKAQQRELTTNELEESKPRVLAAPSFSVTDHTTHTLDHAERRRESE